MNRRWGFVAAAAIGAIIQSIVGVPALAKAEPYQCYVSPQGSDLGKGTLEAPFATLEKARLAVRKAKLAGSEGATVTIRGGVYHLSKGLKLTEADSGTPQGPVVYQAFPGEFPRLVGGREISPSLFTPVTDKDLLERLPEAARGKVFQADLRKAGITDYGVMQTRGFRRPYVNAPMELFIGGKAMSLARWPNKGMENVTDAAGATAFQYAGDRPERWTKASDPWIHGCFAFRWADDTVRLTKVTPGSKTIEVEQGNMFGMTKDARYSVINLLEEIDEPGEYYVSRSSGRLFVYPQGPLEGAEIQLSLLEEPMVSLLGASHVEFRGFCFEASRGIGVYQERGTENLLAGCVLKNLGCVAVVFGKGSTSDTIYTHPEAGAEPQGPPVSGELGSWHEAIYSDTTFFRDAGTRNGIDGCDIYGIGAGAISLGGGDRKTLTPGGSYVNNCRISDYNRLDTTYKSAVNVDGVGNRVTHCEIFDAPHFGLYLHGNDHLIEYNHVHHVVQDSDDAGALYMGRDPSERGNVIRYNYWHDVGKEGTFLSTIYLDDGACGTSIYGNIIARAGAVVIGGGSDNPVRNNIFIDMKTGIAWDDRLSNWAKNSLDPGGIFDIRMSAVDFTAPPYSTRYPEFVKYWDENPSMPKRNPIELNIFLSCKQVRSNDTLKWGPWGKNLVTKADPGFVDMAGGNLALKPDATVFTALPGFEPIPFDKIGPYADGSRALLPRP